MHLKHLHIIYFLLPKMLLLTSSPFGVIAQQNCIDCGLHFIENKGQWKEDFKFKAKQTNGNLFLEKNGFTLDLHHPIEKSKVAHLAHHRHCSDDEHTHEASPFYSAHSLKFEFLNSSEAEIIGQNQLNTYHNYFVNEKEYWRSEVPLFYEVKYQKIYQGINLHVYSKGQHLKYDWIISPGINPKQIKVKIKGADNLKLKDNNLVIQTSVGDLVEMKPYAFQKVNEENKEVKCFFVLKNNVLSYVFPDGYDKSKELIIDPVLVFSTFSGGQSDNWGFTATYDSQGNTYGGGVVFGANYPITTGAYQANYAGNMDIIISKFNNTGSQLLFSTFLGGSGPEMPYSIIVNDNDELYVMGNTGSINFPTSTGAYSTTFNGGVPTVFFGIINYSQGTDIFVTRFNATGTNIIASTLIGGSNNDGLNMPPPGSNAPHLARNYADNFRGEIILDNNQNPIVVSSTRSNNFPTFNAFQPNFGGGLQDAVIFKMTPQLNSLIFSSFFGGSNDDAGYGVQINANDEVYFCGGTMSINLPTTAGALHASYSGMIDGYVTRLNATGNQILNMSYIGTAGYDQSYMIQIDENNDVFLYGQTTGNYPIQAAPGFSIYSNPNSGQFIHKLDPTLNTTIFSTRFGKGSGNIEIVPTAFLVDQCNRIYVSGWGGAVNSAGGNTIGFPVTSDAFQPNTTGGDFYIAVFRENCSTLEYATFFGGPQSSEHVDGGTSRFDKSGTVYHAVCAGCANNNDLPTTPGAWSNVNGSTNCNLAVFKFDASPILAQIGAGNLNDICVNQPVNFTNNSTGNVTYLWNFGDGNTSTLPNPTHIYQNPGVFNITLVVFDVDNCVPPDTATAVATVVTPASASIIPVNAICPGDTIQLQGISNGNFVWLPNDGIIGASNNLNISVNPAVTTTYTLVVSNQCGSDTAFVTVEVIDFNISASDNDTICIGFSKELFAEGGTTYTWSPPTYLDNPNISNPVSTPDDDITYTVTITDINGCTGSLQVFIQVDTSIPQAFAGNDTLICLGAIFQLNASGGNSYLWSPPNAVSDPFIRNPNFVANDDVELILTVVNACGLSTDTMLVSISRVFPQIVGENQVCPGDSILLSAEGAVNYLWFSAQPLRPDDSSSTFLFPSNSDIVWIEAYNDIGCVGYDTLVVEVLPKKNVFAGNDQWINFYDSATLQGFGEGNPMWSPPENLSCTNCFITTTMGLDTVTTFIFTITDENGCKFSDSVTVFLNGIIYIPNAFTPDNNNLNEFFKAKGFQIKGFEMWIFNRWGEEIFYTDDIDNGWNGQYRGEDAKPDVYVYKVLYNDFTNIQKTLWGHFTLLR